MKVLNFQMFLKTLKVNTVNKICSFMSTKSFFFYKQTTKYMKVRKTKNPRAI